MSIRKSSLIALYALRKNRMQTVLTILSLTIGVGTVLAMVAVGSGARRSISNQVRAAGMNIIVVNSGNHRQQRPWNNSQVEDPPDSPLTNPALKIMEDDPEMLGGKGDATTLSLADADAVRAMPKVQAVSAGVHESTSVKAGSATWAPMIRGEQASIVDIRRAWIIPKGRFFTAAEEAASAPVAVLGSIAATGLFGTRNPVGESIEIHGQSFRVIGVIASSTWMVQARAGDGQFDAIYLPVGTAERLFGRDHLDNLTLSTASTGDVAAVVKDVQTELRERHHLDKHTPSDFLVTSQGDLAIAQGSRPDWSKAISSNTPNLDRLTLTQLSKTLERSARTMSVLLASIAVVSLVVGGIGIMNIMLLSVTERTREIGIRREVGARAAEIMQQFLIEAVLLSVCGGLLGIALGAGASALIASVLRWSTELSWIAIGLSFAISAAIGILFGYYPARQASLVTPMTALRYE